MRKRNSMFKTVLLILILLIVSVSIFLITVNFDEISDPSSSENTPSDKPEQEEENPSTDPTNAAARIAEIDQILNNEFMVLVNPENGLGRQDEPEEIVTIDGYRMEKTAATQLRKMLDDAQIAGYTITIYSAFRNYAKQETNFNNKIEQYVNQGYDRDTAEEMAANIVNPPGKSEHQTGLAADICTAEMVYKHGSLPEEFSETEEYTWLYEHCAEYGFILRYPHDKEEITGITFEPWHYRYVGLERAKEIMDAKISLEEYIENLKTEKQTLEQIVAES